MIGTLIGALIIAVIGNGMNLLGLEDSWQLVVRGSVILAAVLFDQVKNPLETDGSTVIGIRNLVHLARITSELEQQSYPVTSRRRAAAQQEFPVVMVHGKDQVEVFEVRVPDCPRPLAAEVDAPAGSRRDGASIGRLAPGVSMGAGRSDLYFEIGRALIQQMREYSFCSRRTTNISHADKKYAIHFNFHYPSAGTAGLRQRPAVPAVFRADRLDGRARSESGEPPGAADTSQPMISPRTLIRERTIAVPRIPSVAVREVGSPDRCREAAQSDV